MIEVELSYQLTPKFLEFLKSHCTFTKEVFIEDVYYDTAGYELMQKGYWLRKRNNEFELKIHQVSAITGASHHELTELTEIEKSICSTLMIPSSTVVALIQENTLIPYCHLQTNRQAYTYQDFIVVLDQTHAQNFEITITEIEKLVSSEEEVPAALDSISNLAKQFELTLQTENLGKVLLFLKKTHPILFQRLQMAFSKKN